MQDPAKVYERIQSMQRASAARTEQAKHERAVKKLTESFKEPADVKTKS